MPGRDNGLVARSYLALADLDPRLADAMLVALRRDGIAAYAVPSGGRVGGYLNVTLPPVPRDRLWVDAEHFDRARAILRTQLRDAAQESEQSPPTPSAPDDIETAWAELVASFDDEPADVPWPAAEDLPPESGVRRRILRSPVTAPQPPTPSPSGVTGEYDPLTILDEHFIPPDPPPPPRLSTASRWAITALLIGVLLIALNTFTTVLPEGTVTLGIAGIVIGLGILVHRMRTDRADDSDPNDGAVV